MIRRSNGWDHEQRHDVAAELGFGYEEFDSRHRQVSDCLERGETVKLSSFGSFVVRKKGQRIGRNPKTGKEVPISPRRVMVFKPSAILKQRINGEEVGEETE